MNNQIVSCFQKKSNIPNAYNHECKFKIEPFNIYQIICYWLIETFQNNVILTNDIILYIIIPYAVTLNNQGCFYSKLVVVGDSGVGKSCFLLRFVHGIFVILLFLIFYFILFFVLTCEFA